MSAETLREAAAEIREDWPSHWVTSHHLSVVTDTKFHRAVADWLDSEARAHDAQTDKQADPDRRFAGVWTTAANTRHLHALAVAHAYLGGAA